MPPTWASRPRCRLRGLLRARTFSSLRCSPSKIYVLQGKFRTITRRVRALSRYGKLVDLEDEFEFEFDRHVQGQLGRAEGQAGMASSLSENLDEEIRRAVDDGWLLGKAFGGGHMSGQSYDAGHAVERTQFLTDHGQGVEQSQPRRFVPLLH